MVSCKVPNCDHSDRKPRNCKFCSIPRNPEMRRTWLKIIGIREENCGVQARICTCHFVDNVRPKILTSKNYIPSKEKKKEKSKTLIAKQKQIEISLKIDALNEPMIEIDDDNAPEIEIIENEIYEFEDRTDIDNEIDEFESEKNIDTNEFNEAENDEIKQNEEETNKRIFGKAKYVCLRCKLDKKEHLFDCQQEFLQHLLEHKDNLVSNACGICHRKFEKREALNDHKRVHTGEKPFKCPECWMRFGQITTLNLHIKRVHEDV